MMSHAQRTPTPGNAHIQAELRSIEQQLIEMASRAEAMVAMAIESLKTLNQELAHRVMSLDDPIDDLDREIEQRCLVLLTLQKPVTGDLRQIGATIKMATDIERVGDLAVDIAKCALKIEKEIGQTDYVDVQPMADIARRMFRESIEAFIKRDLTILEHIDDQEDDVDRRYREIRDQIHEHIRSNPDASVSATWMILVVHHVERIADHALNVSERVRSVLSGFVPEESSHSKNET